jgi:hypothetical protein
MNEAIYISGQQGLGDHLLCNGIYREYASKYVLCIVAVTREYEQTIKRMLSDVANIRIASYPDKYFNAYSLAHEKILKKIEGFDVLMLGSLGEDFFVDPNLRLDAQYYKRANLDLDLRWSNFNYSRNREKERQMFEYFGCKDSDYIFLHEDESRNFLVRRDLIPSNIKIIKPDISLKEFDFFDYTMVIENAKEIHCIESSFAAFIESLPLDVPKFAHRYARPEAKNDFRHEFTYRSSWNIF